MCLVACHGARLHCTERSVNQCIPGTHTSQGVAAKAAPVRTDAGHGSHPVSAARHSALLGWRGGSLPQDTQQDIPLTQLKEAAELQWHR